MTAPSPIPTFTVGQELTAAEMNQIKSWIDYLSGAAGSRPLAVLRLTAAQSLASGTVYVPVLFDTEDLDTAGGHSTTSNTSRFTAPVAGWYQVGASVSIVTSSTTGNVSAALMVNGSVVPGAPALTMACITGNTEVLGVGGHLVFLNAGDYLELGVWQSTGGTKSVTSARLSAAWVSE